MYLHPMLKKQEELSKIYKYKPLPPLISMIQREEYFNNLPKEFLMDIEKINGIDFFCNNFSLNNVKNITQNSFPLYSFVYKNNKKNKVNKIANGWNRIVIGDYGAFIEINDEDIIKENIIVCPGEEYRINDERYAQNIRYHWYIPKNSYPTKLYYQQKEVSYADYKPYKWYISPYEIEI